MTESANITIPAEADTIDGSTLAAERRRAREDRHRRRVARERRRTGILVAAGLLAIAIGTAWFFTGGAGAASRETTAERPAPASAQKARTSTVSAAQIRAADAPEPTPIFGAYRSLQLRLPVHSLDLTEIAFHQASYSWALPMTTTLTDADLASANEKVGTGRAKTDLSGASAVLEGSCLRLWRSGRPGKPNTAADIGAAPGSEVLAPVTGEVTLVRAYKLYGKYDDFEIHIRPNGWAEADVILIHVDDVKVAQGDRVVAGISPIGAVRLLSDRERLQLGEYTKDGGDHVHLQINQGDDPRYIEALRKHQSEGS